MQLEILHHTSYTYDRPVQLQSHLVYMRPRASPGLDVHRFSLTTAPVAAVQWMRDDFDNLCASLQFSLETWGLEINSSCLVSTNDVAPLNFVVRDTAFAFPFAYEPLHRFNLASYLTLPDPVTQRRLSDWLDTWFAHPPTGTVAWLFALNQLVNRSFSYQRRDEPGINPPIVTLNTGSGSCRDLAVFLIQCLRLRGLAARFVSGYWFDPVDFSAGDTAMHAWVEVFLPGAGWKGIDPTHGIFCHETYIPVAHAAVAESVNPIQGSFFGAVPANATLAAQIQIRRAAEVPVPCGFSQPG